MNRQTLSALLAGFVIAGAVVLGGCVQDNIPSDRGATSTGAVVEWPALRSLDDLAHRVDHLVDQGEVEALAELAGRMRETALQVANDAVPSGARDADQVRVLQSDLRSLAESLADSEALGEEALAPAMAAFEPIVHRLMQAAGLPHVHGQHGHNHDDDSPMTLADLEELEGPGHYGGTILEIVDDHSVHAELVVDPENGTMRIYALNEVEEPTSFDDPLSAELVFSGWTNQGHHVSITLFPDASGLTYEHFEGFDENLRGVEWIAGHLTGKFRGSGMMKAVDAEAGWPPSGDGGGHHHEDGHQGHDH